MCTRFNICVVGNLKRIQGYKFSIFYGVVKTWGSKGGREVFSIPPPIKGICAPGSFKHMYA